MFPSLAAVSLNAKMIEAHVVFDKRMFGPDATSSLTIDEFKYLVQGVRDIETMLRNPVNKTDLSEKKEIKRIFEKSLAVRYDLPKGHILSIDDLETKKPTGYGLPSSKFQSVVGKPLKKSLKKWDFLTETDI
ncbi:N-acetylneuraminate synthase family protein [Amylibacter sp.]|nr:N-acetylneuraminate synthase family protein [Amylibacter sp.]